MKKLTLALTVVASFVARADEGMWTFNNFPTDKVKAAYGFDTTKDWLDKARLASVRIAGGCSASLVSANGLVMTNHHCAHECIEQLSSLRKDDFVKKGFFAKTEKDEVKCPDIEMNQLAEIVDVTKRVQDSTKDVAPEKFNEVQRGEIAKIEGECNPKEFKCEVVSLYRGGRYDLYKYKKFEDVRLVFAPEFAIAFFGGDPDNFMFPRYDLDVSFMRIYGEDGKPMKTDSFFPFSPAGAKEGDLTFVSGNPGGTSRTLTVAQLESDRDDRFPLALARMSELRGMLTEYGHRGVEQKRHSGSNLFSIENGLKAYKGRHEALADKAFMASLVKNENEFKARINAKPELKKKYGDVWDGIAATVAKAKTYRKEYNATERGLNSDLFGFARMLVRWADESQKPNEQRLKEFTKSKEAGLKSALETNAPVYPELETVMLTWSLTKMREDLSPDSPVVKKVLGLKSPEEVAKALVKGTKLGDKKFRTEMFKDPSKVAASKDPMFELIRSYDAEARAVRKRWEDEIDGPLKKNQELLAKARFEAFGTSIYPDATFTLRLSYGAVKGYMQDGKKVEPITNFAGAFARHTGAEPFALPKSWLDAKAKLNMETPFNIATSNDIIGGNSGSPVINKDLQVVGLIFDGNIQSLGGDYGFDETVNRAVAVHSSALLESLEKIYGAKRLSDELKPAAK